MIARMIHENPAVIASACGSFATLCYQMAQDGWPVIGLV